jgi:hypothetical protein
MKVRRGRAFAEEPEVDAFEPECENGADIVLMRGPLASVAVFALATGWSLGARAQAPPAPLDVIRGPDVQDCPDATRLADDIARIRGAGAAAATAATAAYSVEFARTGPGLSAAIRRGPDRTNVRLLEVPGQTCAALAHAVAVTLALLFDSDKVGAPEEKPEEVKPPEPVPIEAPSPAPVVEERKRRREATVTLGGSGLFGVLRPASPGLTGELGLEIGRWRTGLGVLWLFPQTLELGPGTVRESLVSGSMRVCYAPWRSDRLRFDVCSGALIGVVTAEGRGYSLDQTRTQPWLAAPLEVAVAGFAGPVGLELGAGALASFQRPDFSVDHLGVAYRSPLVGATVSLRAIGQWGW